MFVFQIAASCKVIFVLFLVLLRLHQKSWLINSKILTLISYFYVQLGSIYFQILIMVQTTF